MNRMYQLGIDVGTSSIKLVLLENKNIIQKWLKRHHGRLLQTLREGLSEIDLPEKFFCAVTGSNSQIFNVSDSLKRIQKLGDIPAIVEGIKFTTPEADSIIDIGGQGARFITNIKSGVPDFNINEHCAGGTGSFFEDQMSRLGMKIEDYSDIVKNAKSVPRLSGRCAVFAKTDIIHRQQEGVPVADILLGLCYAMIRNYRATIVKNLPVKKPVVFTGGVTLNAGAVRAVKEVFELNDDELIIPENSLYQPAIGCALKAETEMTLDNFKEIFNGNLVSYSLHSGLQKLKLIEGTVLKDPEASEIIPIEGCALGIDIGSTSTDLVLTGKDGTLIDFQYLRTSGNPEGAVRKGLKAIHKKFGDIKFLSVGVTGSGRERIGRMIGADAIRDEITAQAKAASFWIPDVDTVFEIGGQDSKYILIRNGEVVDFQMNKICAAGTGSFIEEQAARMDIPISDFGSLALTSEAPSDLGERCTVFIETAVDSAQAEGASQADIAAGLCHSVVKNYLHKVVGNKPVGNKIVLQGGVAYNPGIVAAFQDAYREKLTVSPCFSISGAFGVALLSLEAVGDGESKFVGFDMKQNILNDELSEEVQQNIAFYRKPKEFFYRDYDNYIDPKKKTVGIPYVLIMHKFFPMANAFFRSLGFNVILSDPSDENTIRLSQQYAQGETCYPIKLVYGHMVQLMQKKVDYIFLPCIHTLKHEKSNVENNFSCVYMQSSARSIARILKLEEHGIKLLNPVFDLDFGRKAIASVMLSVGAELGKSVLQCSAALMKGAMIIRDYDAAVERNGRELLESLKPDEKVLVMITRNYGISDPVLNMEIPELLLQRGYKVINLEHLPGHDIDISQDYNNLYWPFGQHIISGAKIIAHHPNLYAVYLTNHGCGPDTMLSHMFREEMGDKPYLQIEVDEHFSKVGIITRIEAFLNSLSHRKSIPISKNFDIKDVEIHEEKIFDIKELKTDDKIFIPDFGFYSKYISIYLHEISGTKIELMPAIKREHLLIGRAETVTKEYLPFTALLGSILKQSEDIKEEKISFLIPSTEGAEADGQYYRAIRSILNCKRFLNFGILSPIVEKIPLTVKNPELFFRAILAGDLLYMASPEERKNLAPKKIPDDRELLELAKKIGNIERKGRRLGIIGTPMSETSLNEGVLEQLELEGEHIIRAPLSEALLFLWNEDVKVNKNCLAFLNYAKNITAQLNLELKNNSSFSSDFDSLIIIADKYLADVSGGNVRYRFSKAVDLSQNVNAVMSFAPRYENAAMVMDMRGIHEVITNVPFTQIYFDGDWDETAWARLRSFLYYC